MQVLQEPVPTPVATLTKEEPGHSLALRGLQGTASTGDGEFHVST